jgi:hypothetical protein
VVDQVENSAGETDKQAWNQDGIKEDRNFGFALIT